jgi:hypothetical protein
MLASSPHRRWSAVDTASVVDVNDVEPFELFVYGIVDSIAAAAGATQTGQLASQRTANLQRLFGQWTEDELQAGSANLLGEAKQITFGAS